MIIITLVFLVFHFLRLLIATLRGEIIRGEVLGCGLMAYSSNKLVDEFKFKLGLLYNKERGTHATGISIDHRITKEARTVDAFLAKWIFTFSNYYTTTVIGHTRQASAGIAAKDDSNAHPFAIYNGGLEATDLIKLVGQNLADEETPEFILAMNGTIDNMWDLDREYKTGWKHNESDSLHLAKIIHKVYKDNIKEVLEAYTGAATLLFYWPEEKDTLYVWKDPDRPLYYYQEDEDTMYISSLRDSLWALGGTDENTKSFKDEHLFKIVAGKIVEETKFTKLKKTYASYYQDGEWSEGGHWLQNKSFRTKEPLQNTPFAVAKKKNDGKISFRVEDMRYYRNNQIISGSHNILMSGLEDSGKHPLGTDYFFIRGIMMRNEEALNTIKVMFTEHGNFNKAKFEEMQRSDLSMYTMYPIKSVNVPGIYLYDGVATDKIFIPKFSDLVLTFTAGKLVATEMVGGKHVQIIVKDTKIPSLVDIKAAMLEELREMQSATYDDLADNIKLYIDSPADLWDNKELDSIIFVSFIAILEESNLYVDIQHRWLKEQVAKNGLITSVTNTLTQLLQKLYNLDLKVDSLNLYANPIFCEEIVAAEISCIDFISKWYKVQDATNQTDIEALYDNIFLVYRDVAYVEEDDFKKYLEQDMSKKCMLVHKVWDINRNSKKMIEIEEPKMKENVC